MMLDSRTRRGGSSAFWLFPAGLSLCTACTTTTVVEPFFRPPDAQVEQAYVSPDADFSIYTKLMADPLEIYYPENAPQPSEEELERLRQSFRDAFLTEIGDDYHRRTGSGSKDKMLSKR